MADPHPSKVKKVRPDAHVEKNGTKHGTGRRRVRPTRRQVVPVTPVTKKKK